MVVQNRSVVRGCALLVLMLMPVWYMLSAGPDRLPPAFLDPTFLAQDEHKNYLVWSSECQIPDMPANHPSIKSLLRVETPIICSKEQPPTYVEGTTLHLNVGAKKKKRKDCCYEAVTRYEAPGDKEYTGNADNMYNISTCIPLNGSVQLQPHEEFILIRCNNEVVTGHATVHPKKSPTPAQDDRLSVLIFGYDSISRLNLLRAMPRTVAVLNRTGWLSFNGYNKVGDNTFPNLMAILTGMSLSEVKKSCFKTATTKLDNCPYLWKDFANKSYVTAYIEDEPTIGSFNYHKTGFVRQPTTYYTRPFFLALQEKAKLKTRYNMNVCLGQTVTADHFFRYTLDLTSFLNNSLYFSLVWQNSFSHNDLNSASAMDVKSSQFFEQLMESNVLNNTVVIFLSDHGMRFGKVRETYIGWLEERLPYLYFWFPSWFKEKYSKAYNNLASNSNRLTSPFDLHLMLRDILDENFDPEKKKEGNGTLGCPKCVSLFSPVPINRSCSDAGVTSHWCTCTEHLSLPVDSKLATTLSKFAVSDIMDKLDKLEKDSNTTSLCAKLKVKTVTKFGRKVYNEDLKLQHDDYIIAFETEPGKAIFEATVRYSPLASDNKKKMVLLGEISRLNMYKNQSDCIKDPEMKLYCYCIDHR